MIIGLRQRLIILIFSGLLLAMAIIGTYRYVMEKQEIINTTRLEGERSSRLMANLAVPYLQTTDIYGLISLVQKFMLMPDIQEVTIVDSAGHRLVYTVKPTMKANRIILEPQPILQYSIRLGEISVSVYPEKMDERLKAYVLSAVIENFFIFVILAGTLALWITRSITDPIRKLGDAVKDLIDRKDFTRRVETRGHDEIHDLANGVNYLIERLEQFIVEMGDIASRISEVSPSIAMEAREVKKNAEGAGDAIANVSSSVAEMSSSIQSVSESAESLSSSAEETSSAILEMNASNEEVARHTIELASSVEDVTSSVSEMIASIREVSSHVESLSSAAEETSVSANQIDATVHEVAQTAKESARISHQVSREAQEIGVKSILETMKAIGAIKSAVARYSDLVTRLGQRSEEIGKILGVIVDVTEKTNLLALNASILAAQAGEHGKGFGVVAEEIKALADRTAGSAQDIGKLIATVQRETREAVAALSESVTSVAEGVQRSQEAGAALDKILLSSTRSSEIAAMIERAMTEQARGIKQVSEAITNVKQMSSQIMSAMHAQTKGTEMILHAAEGMRDIARQVRNAMTEQARGGKQIGAAADNVTTLAGTIAAGTWEERQSIRQIEESIVRIQDLPRQSVSRVEGMVASVETLGEQAELLNREIVTMTVRRGHRYIKGGSLRMGIIPLDTESEISRRFTPLADYLAQLTSRRVELTAASDFVQMINDLKESKIDLAFLTPMMYVEAQRKSQALPLVKALRDGAPYSRGAIVARTDSMITRLEEIKGKRFAFGDKNSTPTYLVPRAMLADAGINLEDLQEFTFFDHDDSVAKAVIAGEYDAGGLYESNARTYENRGLTVIKTSPDIPGNIICASKHLDQETSELIKKALFSLNRKDKIHVDILTAIDPVCTGFATVSDEEFDIIRKLLAKIQGADSPI